MASRGPGSGPRGGQGGAVGWGSRAGRAALSRRSPDAEAPAGP